MDPNLHSSRQNSISESSWTSSKFWQSREKIKVFKSGEHIHIQVTVQKLSHRILEKFYSLYCSILRLSKDREFYQIKEDDLVSGDLTDDQKKEIKRILLKSNRSIQQRKNAIVTAVGGSPRSDSAEMAQPLDAGSFSHPPTITPQDQQAFQTIFQSAVLADPAEQGGGEVGGEGEPILAPEPVVAVEVPHEVEAIEETEEGDSLIDLPSIPDFLVRQEEPAPQRLSKEESLLILAESREMLAEFFAEKPEEYVPATWLGQAFERIHDYALSKSKILKGTEEAISQFFSGSLSVPEEDNHDFAQMMHYQESLLTIEERLQDVEESGELDEDEKIELEFLKGQLDLPLKRLETLQQYFREVEALEKELLLVTDQGVSLSKGKIDYSLEMLPGLFNAIVNLEKIAQQEDPSPIWLHKIQRKIDYQKAYAAELLNDFFEEISKAVKIEFDESSAHLDKVRGELAKIHAPKKRAIVLENAERQLKCFDLFQEKQNQLLADLESIESKDLPDACKDPFKLLLSQQKLISKAILSTKKPKLDPSFIRSEDINIDSVRRNRPVLTLGKKRAIKNEQALNRTENFSPGKTKALTLFFGYLQLWSNIAPVFSSLMTPVVKKDYSVYLSEMAAAQKTGNTEAYQKALTHARAFWGADQEFLDSYDKYLKGEIQFGYSPSPAQRGLPSSDAPIENEQFSIGSMLAKSAEGILPASLSRWIATFLGQTEEGKFLANATTWERYTYYHIFPQYRDNVMDTILKGFEREAPPSSPSEVSTDEQDLYYYFYKMYESSKNLELRSEYETHLEEAQRISQHAELSKEWDAYLRGQWEAFSKSTEEIPTTTVPLGRAVLKSIVKDVEIVDSQIQEMESGIESSAARKKAIESLYQEADKLVNAKMKCERLLQSLPVRHADQATEKKWLKEVDACRKTFISARHEVRGILANEQYREQISLEKFQRYLDAPPLPVTNMTIAQAFGNDFLYGLPLNEDRTLENIEFRLHALKSRITVLKEDFLCNATQTAAFCSEYLANPAFANRVRNPDIIKELETLDNKHQIAKKLSRSFAEESRTTFIKEIKTELGSLAAYDSIFFSENSLGLVFELVKEPGYFFSSYNLRIYSVDPRRDLQKRVMEGEVEKLTVFREIQGISADSFVESLYQVKDSLLTREMKFSAKEIYKHILKTTGGRPNHESSSEEHLAAVSQSSHYQTLVALFSNHLADEEGKRFEFETQAKVLNDVLTQESYYDQDLLKEALQAFSLNVIEFYEKQIISDQELTLATDILEQLNTKIVKQKDPPFAIADTLFDEKAKESEILVEAARAVVSRFYDVVVKQEKSSLDLSRFKKDLLTPEVFFSKELTYTERYSQSKLQLAAILKLIENYDLEPESAKKYLGALLFNLNEGNGFVVIFDFEIKEVLKSFLSIIETPTTFNSRVFLNWDGNPTSLAKGFNTTFIPEKDAIGESGFFYSQKILTLNQNVLIEFVKKIPLNDSGFWNQISKEDGVFVLENLQKVNHLFVEIRQKRSYFSQDKENYLASFKMLALMNKVVNHFQLLDIPIALNVPDISDIEKHLTFNYLEGGLSLELHELKRFWASVSPEIPKILEASSFKDGYDIIPSTIYFPWVFEWVKKNKEEILKEFKLKISESGIALDPRIEVSDWILLYYVMSANEFTLLQGKTQFEISKENSRITLPTKYKLLQKVFFSAFPMITQSTSVNYGVAVEVSSKGFIEENILFGYQNLYYAKHYFLSTLAKKKYEKECLLEKVRLVKIYEYKKDRENRPIISKSEESFLEGKEILIQDLLSLKSYPETQIQSALSYFTKNTALLTQKHFQDFFLSLVFESDLLFQEFQGKSLKDNQKFVQDLHSFCKKSISYYESILDYKTLSFFLVFTHKLNITLGQIQKLYPEAIHSKDLSRSYDTSEKFQGLLANEELTLDEKALINRHYSKTFFTENVWSKETVKELISTVIRENIYPLPEHYKAELGFYWQDSSIELLRLKGLEIKKLLLGEEGGEILNGIYRNFHPNARALRWNVSELPVAKSEDGTIELNVLTGELKEFEVSLTYLPPKIIKGKEFREFFGNQEKVLCAQIDDHSYVISGPHGRQYRVIQQGVDPLIIQTKFNGSWYQLDKQNNESIFSKALAFGQHYWFSDKQKHPSGFFTHREKGTATYAVSENVIFRLDEQEKLTSETAVSLNDQVLKELIAGIDGEWNIVFKDRGSGEMTYLAFPRLGLEFQMKEMDEGKRFFSLQHPESYLSKKQTIQDLSRLRNYLVLETKQDGDVSTQVLVPQPKSLIHPSEEIKTSSFDLNPVTKRLVAKTSGERFHLAYLYLKQRDYAQAATHLVRSKEELKPYDHESKNILQHIAELDLSQFRDNPRLNALKLKAFSLLLKDSQDISRKGEFEIFEKDANQYLDVYCGYLKAKKHLAASYLSQDDERLLLREIAIYLNPIVHLKHKLIVSRMKELKVPLSKELSRMDNFISRFDPLDESPLLGFDKISSDHLLDLFQKTPFYEEYRFLRGVNSPEKQPWDELRDFAYSLAGEKPGFFSRFQAYSSLVAKVTSTLKAKQAGADVSSQLKYLLLSAVMDHPEDFPDDLQILETLGSSQQQKSWVFKKIVSPLKKLVLEDENLQAFLSPLPSEKPAVAKTKEKEAPLRSFDFSGLKQESSLPIQVDLQFVQEVSGGVDKTIQVEGFLSGLKTYQESAFTSTMAKKQVEQLLEEVKELKESVVPKVYQITDVQGLQRAKAELRRGIDTIETETQRLRESIESLVNHASLDIAQKAIQKARFFAEQDAPIEMDQVIQSYLKQDIHRLLSHNPALTDVDFKEAFEEVHRYLDLSVQKNHLAYLEGKLVEIERLNNEGTSLDNLQDLTTQFFNSMLQRRNYDVQTHPEYLVFEYYAKFQLRKDQVESLDALKINHGVITEPQHIGKALELIMGSGKTSVIIPLLSLMNANGKNLAAVVMPKFLIESMFPDLQDQMAVAFNQMLTGMEFNRNSRFDKKSLQRVLDRFLDIKENKKTLLISSESVQALFLKMAEKIGELKEQTISFQELVKEVKLFLEIFDVMKASGSVVVDEIDSILDVLRSFHYTLGKSADYLPASGKITKSLYQYMTLDPSISEYVIPSSKDVVMTETRYREGIKPVLVKAVLDGKICKDELHDFIKKLWGGQRSKVEKFLNGDLNPSVMSFIDAISDPHIQDALAVLKEQINELLPLTLSKREYKQYGPSMIINQGGENLLAVPYHLGRPSKPGTQFGTDLEVINYTIQMYLNGKFTSEVMTKIVGSLQKGVREYLDQNRGATLDQVPYYQFFKSFFGEERVPNILTIGTAEIEGFTQIVNSDPNKILQLVLQMVLPEKKTYQRQLNADAQLFGVLFKQIQGLSGTLWNAQTFPKMIGDVKASDSNVRTLSLIWNDDPVKIIPAASSSQLSLKETVKAFTLATDKLPSSVIDAANVFSGVENENIAKSLYEVAKERQWDVEGVIFYDSDDRLMVISKIDDRWEKTEKSLVLHKKLLAYWDQSHTIGSNIILSSNMRAGVSVGRDTLLKDFTQGVWRLRGLADSQKVHVVTTAGDREFIVDTIKKQTGRIIEGDLSLTDVIIYLMIQQCRRQGEDNYRSFKQKLNALALDKVLGVMFKTKEMSSLLEIYEIGRGLFESFEERRPYFMYSSPSEELPKSEVMNREVTRFLNSPIMAKMRRHQLFKALATEIQEEALLLKQSEEGNLPDVIKQTQSYGKERSLQTQAESETQKQSETQKEVSLFEETTNETGKKAKTLFPEERKLRQFSWSLGPDFVSANKDFLQSSQKALLPAFDSDLLCSRNLCQGSYLGGFLSGLSVGVAIGLKNNFSQLLLIKNKETGTLQAVMIDGFDLDSLKKMMQNDRLSEDVNHLMLYDLNTGLYMQAGREHYVEPSELEVDLKFQSLKVQAKFFKGEMDYSSEELGLLEKWFLKSNYLEIKKFYLQTVIPLSRQDTDKFLISSLGKLFKKMDHVVESTLSRYLWNS